MVWVKLQKPGRQQGKGPAHCRAEDQGRDKPRAMVQCTKKKENRRGLDRWFVLILHTAHFFVLDAVGVHQTVNGFAIKTNGVGHFRNVAFIFIQHLFDVLFFKFLDDFSLWASLKSISPSGVGTKIFLLLGPNIIGQILHANLRTLRFRHHAFHRVFAVREHCRANGTAATAAEHPR